MFTTTAKDAPAEAELQSHRLLVRAGYIKQHSSGVFSILPLGLRCMQKIEQIVREEMNWIGGQELLMPVVITGDLWKESGRWETVREELLRFKDRNGKDMVLGMTHEEVITDIARRYLNSYRQLPAMAYQIQTKYRDEARPRGGLIRLREFIMKDAYSFHSSAEDLDEYYQVMYQAYLNVYHRSGLPVMVVASDPGMMGGKIAHEFMTVTPGGEDTLVLCAGCDYAANREIAKAARHSSDEQMLELEKVATPGCETIADVAGFLGVPAERTAKSLAYRDAEGTLYLVLVRGDLEINAIKLQNYVKTELEVAKAEDMTSRGLVPGYMSPVGVEAGSGLRVIVDRSVAMGRNLVAGANHAGYHLKSANPGRDFAGEVADVANVVDGDVCEACGGELRLVRAIEVGNIFKLGTKYSQAMGALFTDEEGQVQPMAMGCYGIGIARILASLVEVFADDSGMRLPITVSPYEVHLVGLDLHKNETVRDAAEAAYAELMARGLDVLYDDRRESPGVKFKDADLIGVPIRVTISPRTLGEGQAEIKLRTETEMSRVEMGRLADEVWRIKAGMLCAHAVDRQDTAKAGWA